jgi:hypothetical protein
MGNIEINNNINNVNVENTINNIDVNSDISNILVVPQEITTIIEVITPGPVGRQGPPGSVGPSGSSVNTGSFVTTSSFNNFTASYNTGSFTGSFLGNGSGLTNIVSASYALISLSSSYSITSSYSINASQALTASYVLNSLSSSYSLTSSYALNVPTSSVSSSYAVSSSFATSASFAISSSIATSASFAVSSSRAISSSFAISASWAPMRPGGSDTQIQFNSGSTLVGTGSFTFNYQNQSLQQGFNVTASGIYSHAEGQLTQATQEGSHAEGFQTIASGLYAHAEGDRTQALGSGGHAEGIFTVAQTYAHAEGDNTQAIGYASHAEGVNTQAIGNHSHAEGFRAKTGITTAFGATGRNAVLYGLVIIDDNYGDVTTNFTPGGYLYLYDNEFDQAYGWASFKIDTVVFNDGQTEIQLFDTSVTTTTAYVGDLTYLQNNGYFGGDQVIPGPYAHAEGYYTQAIGPNSHAEGRSSQAIGEYSHAEGDNVQAIGNYSHAEGAYTQATGEGSHAEGQLTVALGSYSHAEGSNTVASEIYSHAEGQNTISSGYASHAEGAGTEAIGEASHAEGYGTQAIGRYSHAEGLSTISSGSWSHAEGNNTIALGDYQHVQGQFNISSSAQSAFIIGNGINSTNRSNLVFASGSIFQITGSVEILDIGTSISLGNNSGIQINTSGQGVSITSTQGQALIVAGGSNSNNIATFKSDNTDETLAYISTSGSIFTTASITATQGITGSLFGTASWATNAITASYALNGGVTQLLAGPNITLAPTNGLGQVTISSTSGGGGFNTATGSYGSFYDTTLQTNPVANIPRSMSLNTTDITNGISISGSTNPFNTYIKTENAGVYNIQFSAQLDKTDGGSDEIIIWLRKNGTDLTDTATTITLSSSTRKQVAAWNWFVTSAANDYYQIIWISADTGMRLLAETISATHPGIPSVIVTANRVDQFLSNTGSFSGSFTGQFTGSLEGTASFAINARSASFATTSQDGIKSLNSITSSAQTLITGSTGTDFNIISTGSTHTFNLPTASSSSRGVLNSTDWNIFNNKQKTITSGTAIPSGGVDGDIYLQYN